jgi:signal transduction histidine kinase
MNFYAITGLINGIVGSFLGLFVYSKNKKALTNRTFGLFCLAVSVWSYSYYLWQISTTEKAALFWSKGLMAGAIFIAIFYFHFVLGFIKKVKEYKTALVFGYLVFTLFFFANFTPYFVKNVTPKLNFPYWPNPGILYHPFLLLWVFYVIFPAYLLIRKLPHATGVLKSQIKWLLVGTIIGYGGGITNYLLWYNIPIPPIGNWTATFYLLIVSYSFLKYHLLEIRVILTELLVGLIALILLVQALVTPTFWLQIIGFLLLILFGISGYLLIKSVLKEIKYREELRVAKENVEKAYETEKKAYEELKKLDKVKDQFTLITQHHLRTPLSAMKGYVSMVLEGTYGKISEKVRKPLISFQQSTERLIKLVNEFLDISQFQMGKGVLNLKDIQIGDLLSEIIQELKPETERKSIYLKFEKPKESLPKIKVDPEKLKVMCTPFSGHG